jgi:hypothetical protein
MAGLDRFKDVMHGILAARKGSYLADAIFPDVQKKRMASAMEAFSQYADQLNNQNVVVPSPVDPSGSVGVTPPKMYNVMPSMTSSGDISLRLERNPNYTDPIQEQQKRSATKDTDMMSKVNESKLTSRTNLGLVAENLYDLNNLLVEGYKEGGVGNKVRASKTKLAMGGWMPMDMADEYAKSSAIPGKRVEIVSKMMPMLTQQIGKQGSVRLVESIFEKLGQSLPGLETSPKQAKEQSEASLMSMYRVIRSLEKVDLNNYKLRTEEGKQSFIDDVAEIASNINLSDKEMEEYENLRSVVSKPIDEYINSRSGNKAQTKSGITFTYRAK